MVIELNFLIENNVRMRKLRPAEQIETIKAHFMTILCLKIAFFASSAGAIF